MIHCLLVDDEPIAIRVLTSHLDKIPDVEVTATCTNSVEALRLVEDESIDLVFLDIEMPALSGIGFVEAFAHPPRFIFTTAHRDYAVRGYELDAVDYLLKPISFPRLLRAIEKYRRLEGESAAAETGRSLSGVVHAQGHSGVVNVPVDRRTVRIDPRDIVYVESMSDYVIVHTEKDRYTAKLRISDLEHELAAHGFVRIHRSYLAPLWRVQSFTSSEIQIGPTALPVSRTYRQQVMELLRDAGA